MHSGEGRKSAVIEGEENQKKMLKRNRSFRKNG